MQLIAVCIVVVMSTKEPLIPWLVQTGQVDSVIRLTLIIFSILVDMYAKIKFCIYKIISAHTSIEIHIYRWYTQRQNSIYVIINFDLDSAPYTMQTDKKPIFSFIMTRTSKFSMIWWWGPLCAWATRLVGFL